MLIHALIPARSGSKGIPGKNIKIYKQYPLIAHSILSAKKEKNISKIIVSTDSVEIQNIAIQYGADCPFLRPSNISGDLSSDLECFQHYLNWLKNNNQILPDILVHLRPTYPERKDLLSNCLNTFLDVRDKYSSLRTVIPIDKSLFKMYTITSKKLNPTYFEYKDIKEPFNQARQLLPVTYLHNGCVDIINRSTIENNSMTGHTIYAYIMDKHNIYDIDTEEDWNISIQN